MQKNSLKVNVNVNGKESNPTEVYKPIHEDNILPPISNGLSHSKDKETQSSEEQLNQKPVSESESVASKMTQQEENAINDGADEQMLDVNGTEDNEALAAKREEVKFIKGNDHQNGDAKIDIGALNAKAFTGMTKEELMKYANDPFWVRLRWIFFIAFWAIWLAMLVGAIWIIVAAPKCAAPEPLPWYKLGPLAKFKSYEAAVPEDVKEAEKIHASGVIYELPAQVTYAINEPAVKERVQRLVDQYKESGMKVILDVTANYVNGDSELMKNALADMDKRSAFIWLQRTAVPNNWLSMVNGSAWSTVQPGQYVLSQFNDGLYDLHMNDTLVKEALSSTLRQLIEMGVGGIRLRNTKYYLLTKNIKDEEPSRDSSDIHDQYGFWTHTQTTFQDGLGDVLYEYLTVVKNASADAFLSVADDVERPEVYKTNSGEYGIDMPIYGRVMHFLSMPKNKHLPNELQSTLKTVGSDAWLQWNFDDIVADTEVNSSALTLFASLLPGVPVIPMHTQFDTVSEELYKKIQQLRESNSYMHGGLDIFENEPLLAYTRIKSGNPGYFVAFNPTDTAQIGNFTHTGLPEQMRMVATSDNFNTTNINSNSKFNTGSIEISPYSTIILTYVPVKSD